LWINSKDKIIKKISIKNIKKVLTIKLKNGKVLLVLKKRANKKMNFEN
jgi:hypothetical protein